MDYSMDYRITNMEENFDNETQTYATYNMFKSEKLNVYTIEQKIALSNFDDKRYILDDGHTTLAHGHYRIPLNFT